MPTQAKQQFINNPDLLKKHLEEHFQNLMNYQFVNSSLVAVESLDGAFNWVRARGPVTPEGEEMDVDTPFWMASVTKLYIAAVIFKLHEQGQVSINESMGTYLPAHLIHGLHWTKDGVDQTDKITLKHLLGHSSGLPDYLEDHPENEKSLFDQILEDGDRSWSLKEGVELIREKLPAHFPPQPLDKKKKKIRYSDTNYQLLIAIIETVTGQQLSEVFDNFLLQPLGLEATFHPGSEKAKSFPHTAKVWHGEELLDVPEAMGSFKDLNSTAGDMLKFMRALTQGAIFDNPKTFDLMRSDFNTFGFSLNPAPKSPTWPIEYGLGLMRLKMPRLFSPFNPIPPVIGHTGISGSWLFFCPEIDLLLAGTVNQIAAAGMPFRIIPRLLADRAW